MNTENDTPKDDDLIIRETPIPPIAPSVEIVETVITPLEKTATDKVTGNFELKDDINFSKPPLEKLGYTISLPSVPLNAFIKKITAANNSQSIDINSKEYKSWNEVAEQSLENFTLGGIYQDRFNDPASHFRQGIETSDNNLIGIGSPKFKKTDGEIKGEVALLKVSKMLGLGDVLTIPLPHSGITVTIKPPTERAVIDFYNTVFREKIYMGRETSGLTLSNHSVYINNRLFDFMVAHIHQINYSDITKDQLRNFLLIHDFHILAWGFAATMYPNGFEYQRPCCNDLEKCMYVAKATLNMLKLYCVDNTALTEMQKSILAEQRPGKLTADNYRKYQTEHTRVKSRTVTLKNNMQFMLKVPTFNEHVTDGLAWVNKLNTAIDNVIVTEDNESDVKREVLQQYVKSSQLRQFSHFVDYIVVDENPVTDRDTINSILELLSSEDEIRLELSEAILIFKSDTTIALIGIPEYTCPSCKKSQNEEPVNEALSSAIPLDVMSLFFTLLTLRMSRILER